MIFPISSIFYLLPCFLILQSYKKKINMTILLIERANPFFEAL